MCLVVIGTSTPGNRLLLEKLTIVLSFDVLRTVHLSIILVINQLNAHILVL